MEVTKSNFKEALESITTLVKEADFISFDLELTGLGRNLGDRNNDLDTPAQRYQKAMKRVREYGITQIGISLFRYCKISKKYLNATFCFFVAGNVEGFYRYDTSSMIFLAQNGFDFNKLFLDGLTFISLTEEEELRIKRHETLDLEKEKTTPSPIKLKDQQAKKFVESSIKKVKDSMEEGAEPAVFEGKNMNGFLRKLLFNNVAVLFPTSLFQSMGGQERNIKVLHFTSEEEKYKYLDTTWENELSEQLGFGHVVKAILESNKPLVGHNMILDILHFVDKFIIPLPNNLNQFKSVMKANMPVIYDTKVLARDPPFSANIINTSLGSLYEELTSGYSPPAFGAEEGHQSYSIHEDGQAHDGGFDAFMTGVAFITMLKTLEGKRWAKDSPVMKSKSLQKYSNKINFMGSYDIPFIDIEHPDVIPDRSYIFNVTCPSTWTFMNVRHVFASLKSYKTVWANDTRLFVIPQDDCDSASSERLLPQIRAACSPNVRVELFEQKGVGAKEDGRKQNGRNSSSNKRAVKDDVVPPRPSSISLKRTSDAAKSSGPKETGTSSASENAGDETSRSLKRLKSVGSSELLSNMTLESPMNVEKEILEGVVAQQKDKEARPSTRSKNEVFSEPEDW